MRRPVIFTLALTVCCLASCSRKPAIGLKSASDTASQTKTQGSSKSPPAIWGRWLTPTGGSIDFRENGSATMAGPNGSYEVQYLVLDQHVIEIKKPGGTSAIRWQILSVGAQELVIRDAEGKEVKLRRSE